MQYFTLVINVLDRKWNFFRLPLHCDDDNNDDDLKKTMVVVVTMMMMIDDADAAYDDPQSLISLYRPVLTIKTTFFQSRSWSY